MSATALLPLILGARLARCIAVAAKLGIADQLEKGPRTADDLARATGANGPALHRLLRALASVGIFAEQAPRTFALTPLADPLRTAAPGSLRALAIASGEPLQARAWAELLHSVQTGKTGFAKAHGKELRDHLAADPAAAAQLTEAQAALASGTTDAVTRAYDFGVFKTVADVGGAPGHLICAILKAYPKLRAVLFDQPAAVEAAKKVIEAQGMTGRCQCAPGDVTKTVPAGAEGYLGRHLVRDWDDERAVAILKNVRRAMGGNARFLLVEAVIAEGNAASPAKLADVDALVMTGGKERTEAELKALLVAAGFHLNRVIPTPAGVSVLEALPAGTA